MHELIKITVVDGGYSVAIADGIWKGLCVLLVLIIVGRLLR